ncbi:MAG: SusD/RagB family nutrient-binding outer membrane lipoprotein [Bacteroidetes bacterium]|jgi:hypothetical protein|nr:SusD/RagB family nutrient-binding outer membrane lipoprotein [Bacteroidota bacterium]
MHYLKTLTFRSLLVLALVVGLVGCDSLTDGYDKDPNAATDAPGDLILNGAMVGNLLVHEANLARTAGIFSNQFTGADRQYSRLDNYEQVSSDYDALWGTTYEGVIGDIIRVKEKARSANDRLLLGIAQVIEAHAFGTAASLFGDIPFTEAGQGNDNLNPALDGQDVVIASLTDSLRNQAIPNIEAGGIGPGTLDIHFSGDADSWIEVAYTLLARYELYQGNYDAALAAAENGISSSLGNLVGPHDGTRGVNMNPYHEFIALERAGYLTGTGSHGIDRLGTRENAKTDESARLTYFYGDGSLNTDEGGAFGASSDMMLITYVENELIKAEAELLSASGSTTAALEALNAARDANDAFFGGGLYDAYEIADFESGGIANNGGSTDASLLAEVLEEKYLSYIGNIEAFTDLRRTANYIGVPTKAGANHPQRFLYAQVEVNANENIPDPVPGTFEATALFDVNNGSYAGNDL